MKKIILLLILLIAFTNCAKSQQSDLFFFSEKLCNSFNSSDMDNPKEELFKLVQSKSNEIYQKFPEKLTKLKNGFKQKHPNKNESELALLIGQEISLLAIENCPIFQKITQKIAVPEPTENKKSVTNVSNELCNLLNDSPDKKASTLNKIVDDKLFDLVFKNKALIEKEYGDFGSSEYKTDLNATLMKECDIYYKLVMKQN